MIINETNIPDINECNINYSKMKLGEDLAKNIYPLFNDIYTEKKDKYENLHEHVKINKNKLINKKKHLQEILSEVKRKRKITKLIERIEKIVDSGVTYETSLRHEMVVLLRSIDKMSDEKLDYNLNRTLKIIGKRLADR